MIGMIDFYNDIYIMRITQQSSILYICKWY